MGDMVKFDTDGGPRGHLAIPVSGSGPGVIVIQEWWGLNPQMKGVADMLAVHGIVALAPDLYHGELAGHDEMDKAGELMTSLPAGRAAADMSAAVDFLLGHEAVTGDGIGVVGFCMGGMLTLLLAASRGDAVKVAVPFYGYPPPEAEPDWDGLTAMVRGHFAEADEHFPSVGARDLEARLQAMGKDVQITFHGASHAWMNETDPFGIYDPQLAAELWPQVLGLLRSELA